MVFVETESILYGISFYLQDILFPLCGYYKKYDSLNPDLVSVATENGKYIARGTLDDWIYVNPVTIYPSLYDRVLDLLSLSSPPAVTEFNNQASIVGLNNNIVDFYDYLKGVVVFQSQPQSPIQMKYVAKKIRFTTTPPEDGSKIQPPQVTLTYNGQVGRGAEIGSANQFVSDFFVFDVWAQNDTELIRIGNLIRKSLRISIPLIDWSFSGFPVSPKNGKGMEPRVFDPVSNTVRWCNIKNVTFNALNLAGASGPERYRGTGRIETEIVA